MVSEWSLVVSKWSPSGLQMLSTTQIRWSPEWSPSGLRVVSGRSPDAFYHTNQVVSGSGLRVVSGGLLVVSGWSPGAFHHTNQAVSDVVSEWSPSGLWAVSGCFSPRKSGGLRSGLRVVSGGLQVVSEWSSDALRHANQVVSAVISGWSPGGFRMLFTTEIKWSPSGFWLVSEWSPNGLWVVSRCFVSHKSGGLRCGLRVVSKWSPGSLRMLFATQISWSPSGICAGGGQKVGPPKAAKSEDKNL